MSSFITGKSNKDLTLKPEKQNLQYVPALHAGKRNTLFFTVLVILVICFFILDIFFGSVSIKPDDIVKAIFSSTGNNIDTIIFKFRLPKAVTALTIGIALSMSGLQMQTIFRNPLAGPYVLGVSSGASLGVAFVIL
jgi:iron complex transport system permease protein